MIDSEFMSREKLPPHVYAVMCGGGMAPEEGGAHNGCTLSADLPEHKPSITSFRSDLLIYQSIHSEGQNFQFLRLSGQYNII